MIEHSILLVGGALILFSSLIWIKTISFKKVPVRVKHAGSRRSGYSYRK